MCAMHNCLKRPTFDKTLTTPAVKLDLVFAVDVFGVLASKVSPVKLHNISRFNKTCLRNWPAFAGLGVHKAAM
jgi:hypothetical protein